MSTKEYEYTIFQAVRYGTPPILAIKKVKQCIEKGVDANLVLYRICDLYVPNENKPRGLVYHNHTLLTIAIIEGHYHIIKTLIENGADCNIKNENDEKPLNIALSYWYRQYCYNKIRNVVKTKTTTRYKEFWFPDEEIRSYRIFKYLVSIGATLDAQIHQNTIQINAILEREILQQKADKLLEWVLNEKTNTNIGTMIIQEQNSIFENYLSYRDVV